MSFKPAAFFGVALPGSGFSKMFGTAGVASLAGPSGLTATFQSGVMDGEIDITVTDLPTAWGDSAVVGDGAGTIGTLDARDPANGTQEIADPAATATYTISLPIAYWGTNVEVKVRAVNAQGQAGAWVSDTIAVPGAVNFLDDLVIDESGTEAPVLDVNLVPMTIYVRA